MSTHFFGGLRTICMLVGIGVSLAAGLAEAEEPDYFMDLGDFDKTVRIQLCTLQKDLGEWEAEVTARNPRSAEDAWLWLNLALRAGNTPHALAAVEVLAERRWGIFPVVPTAAFEFARKMRNPEVARAVCEKFPEEFHQEFSRVGLFSDWTDEQVLAWLEARWKDTECWEAEHAERVNISPYRSPASQVWHNMMCELLQSLGRLDPERERFAQLARQESARPGLVVHYLLFLKRFPGNKPLPDLTWTVEPWNYSGTLDGYRVANALADLQCFELQERALLHLLDSKLTSAETWGIPWNFSAMLPLERFQQLFEIRVREELAECCRKLKKTEDANRWKFEASELSEKHYTVNFQPAARTEPAAEPRTVGNEVRENAKEETWLEQLENRPIWGYVERCLLKEHLSTRSGENLETNWEAVEKMALADGADPSRAAVLGQIIKERGFDLARAIELYELALERYEKIDLDSTRLCGERNILISSLFSTCLNTKNAARAEALFLRYPECFATHDFQRLTDVARQCGETEIAARQEARIRNMWYVPDVK